jgi:Family of unknown function (DUF5681)
VSRNRSPSPPRDGYAVGYGRPPVGSRFKSGQSGNPNGRPKKVQELGAVLDRALNARVVVNESGRRRTITMREAIVRGIVNDAARRDPKAIRLLLTLLHRHSPGTGAAPEAASVLAEDQAILADFLARHSPTASSPNGTPHDGRAGDLTDSLEVTRRSTDDEQS